MTDSTERCILDAAFDLGKRLPERVGVEGRPDELPLLTGCETTSRASLHSSSAPTGRLRAFVSNKCFELKAGSRRFQHARLGVESRDRGKALRRSQLRTIDRTLQHSDGLIEHLDRHWKGMPVLTAVGE